MISNYFRLGLIGYPVAHSISPQIHGAGLAVLGLEGEYQCYPVPPQPEGAQGLGELVRQIRVGYLTGLNVTIPHKQTVIALTDDLTPAARAIGAVNTLYLQDGNVIGDNTDVGGFQMDFSKLAGNLAKEIPTKNTTALVLGAGGSARAVVYALKEGGYTVALAARNQGQANHLAEELRLGDYRVGSLDRAGLEAIIGQCDKPIDLVVNTTPLGMWPNLQNSPWPTGLVLPAGALVYDLVYNPLESKFVKDAHQSGHPAIGGLGMLVEQAALAFQIWTSRPAPRQEMFKAAENALKNNKK